MRKKFILSIIIIFFLECIFYAYWPTGLWSLTIFGPYIIIGLYDLNTPLNFLKCSVTIPTSLGVVEGLYG